MPPLRASPTFARFSTLYALTTLDLKTDGPTVIELPPGMLGMLDSAWFKFIGDFGLAGQDKGKGGKCGRSGSDSTVLTALRHPTRGRENPAVLCRWPFETPARNWLVTISQFRRNLVDRAIGVTE